MHRNILDFFLKTGIKGSELKYLGAVNLDDIVWMERKGLFERGGGFFPLEEPDSLPYLFDLTLEPSQVKHILKVFKAGASKLRKDSGFENLEMDKLESFFQEAAQKGVELMTIEDF